MALALALILVLTLTLEVAFTLETAPKALEPDAFCPPKALLIEIQKGLLTEAPKTGGIVALLVPNMELPTPKVDAVVPGVAEFVAFCETKTGVTAAVTAEVLVSVPVVVTAAVVEPVPNTGTATLLEIFAEPNTGGIPVLLLETAKVEPKADVVLVWDPNKLGVPLLLPNIPVVFLTFALGVVV